MSKPYPKKQIVRGTNLLTGKPVKIQVSESEALSMAIVRKLGTLMLDHAEFNHVDTKLQDAFPEIESFLTLSHQLPMKEPEKVGALKVLFAYIEYLIESYHQLTKERKEQSDADIPI